MTAILAILTIAVLIILDLVKHSKENRAPAPVQPRFRSGSVSSLVIERYFHPGHCWVLVHGNDPAIVGIDDFSQRLIGELDAVDLPAPGDVLRQGEPFITLHRGYRLLTQVAPISGTILNVNEKLNSTPWRVNRSPYEKGWIARIKPSNLSIDLSNLLKGSVAERWQDAIRSQLFRWFTPNIGPVLQDGGTFVENIGDLLTDDEWLRIKHEFFPNVHTTAHNKGVSS